MTMKALIVDPNARRGFRFGDVAEPKPTAGQALVEVHAISFNWGELAFLDHMHKPGDIPGWDAAEIVVRAAADGSVRRRELASRRPAGTEHGASCARSIRANSPLFPPTWTSGWRAPSRQRE